MVGDWWVVAVGGWRLAVGSGWRRLVVGGCWSLRAVLKGGPEQKKKLPKDPPVQGSGPAARSERFSGMRVS